MTFDGSETRGDLAEDVGMTSDELREKMGQDGAGDDATTPVITAPPD